MQLMRHESIETTMKFYVGRNADTTAAVLWEAHRNGNTFGNTRPAATSRLSSSRARLDGRRPLASGSCSRPSASSYPLNLLPPDFFCRPDNERKHSSDTEDEALFSANRSSHEQPGHDGLPPGSHVRSVTSLSYGPARALARGGAGSDLPGLGRLRHHSAHQLAAAGDCELRSL